MGSDHKPLVFVLEGSTAKQPPKRGLVEVWKVGNIPVPPDDVSWVAACHAKFTDWTSKTGSFLGAVAALSTDSARIADILDWSFQKAIDEVATEHLGTRIVG